MVAALGAEPYFVDPHEHDAYVAGISHLPFLISAALMNATSSDPAWRDMKTLTAGGFRDVSRLAAGSPTMHRDIVVTNRDAVIRWIDSFVDSLSEVKASLQADDERARKEVLAYLTRARDARAEWATQTTREGELLHNTGAELAAEGVSDQMGRMLLGGFSRRRRALVERSSRQRNERSPRS
jgi:prephenate dehydrogenase